MIKTYIKEPGSRLTEEQITEIEKAKKHPVIFDEDCEELSDAMIKAFRCVIKE